MSLDGLDKLVVKGQRLLDEHEPVETHSEFNRWVGEVSRWLSGKFPDSGLSADWAAQGDSNLVLGGGYYDDPSTWSIFRMRVQARLRWLGSLPLEIQIAKLSAPAQAQNEAKRAGRKEIKLDTVSRAFVDPDRVNEIKAITNDNLDLSKLVRLCEELNVCFAGECYLSMVMLIRAILDHVPPVFKCKTFSEVANNYSGAKSFKQAIRWTPLSRHKIGQIKREFLPVFSNTILVISIIISLHLDRFLQIVFEPKVRVGVLSPSAPSGATW